MPTNQHATIIRNLIAPLTIEERQALLAQLLGEQLVQKPAIVAQKTIGKRTPAASARDDCVSPSFSRATRIRLPIPSSVPIASRGCHVALPISIYGPVFTDTQ